RWAEKMRAEEEIVEGEGEEWEVEVEVEWKEKEIHIDTIYDIDELEQLVYGEEGGGAVPKNFGAPRGAEISNKYTILEEIDEALGVSKPPAVEYIFVQPYSDMSVPYLKFGFGRNPYGQYAPPFSFIPAA